MPDDDAPPPSPDYYETPYSIQRPDGSIDSGTLHTDQPVTHGWLSDYAQSQGGVYLGAPQPTSTTTTTTQPPPELPPPLPPNATDADRARRAWALGSYEPPAPAPAPASLMPPTPAPTPVAPPRYFLSGPLDYAYAPPGVEPSPTRAPEAPAGTGETIARVAGMRRSLKSQVPSIIGATTLAPIGAAAGLPLGPEASMVTGGLAAGAGSALGEGATILGEKVTGAEPAEEGTAVERMGNAFIRGTGGELITVPFRYPAALVASKLSPIIDAAKEAGPLLNDATTQLGQWWAGVAKRTPEQIGAAWDKLVESGDAQKFAGRAFDSVQQIIDTIGASGKGISPTELLEGLGLTSAVGGAIHTGNPYLLAAPAIPVARGIASRVVPFAAGVAARVPSGLRWLANLPETAALAEPFVYPLRAGAQALVAKNAPSAQETFEPEH